MSRFFRKIPQYRGGPPRDPSSRRASADAESAQGPESLGGRVGFGLAELNRLLATRELGGVRADGTPDLDHSSNERAEHYRFLSMCGLDDSSEQEGSGVDYSSNEQAEHNRFLSMRDLGTGRADVDYSSNEQAEYNRFLDMRDLDADGASVGEAEANPLAEILRNYTASYTAIPVVVGAEPDGTPIVVEVQAPYAHMGTRNDTWMEAKATIDGNPVYREMGDAGALGFAAWDSHATATEMQQFLQQSVERGLVGTTAAEMRQYLVEHNFTVDCSSFVSHALEAMGAGDLDRGYSQNYLGGGGISEPDVTAIRTGDVMVRPKAETGIGHVRMVISVEVDGDMIRFTTGESSGSRDLTETDDQGSGYGSVGEVRWQFSKSGGWETLERSVSGEDGSFRPYSGTDVLRRLDGIDASVAASS